ncbi:hypothetical protein RJ639_021128 [Escallonia herrerae]|uniref:Reverse transcriptase/retrotransposon-derived protein RNase H-like domain-containing protein n=1 Tax=Escallonia herrerae TaxID=1293975 RepID=A0AA88V3H4_9ASTE|nr:hypothetical protein RJ639_021128 [Escallonia herrerae]
MEKNESLAHYLERFNGETLEVHNLDNLSRHSFEASVPPPSSHSPSTKPLDEYESLYRERHSLEASVPPPSSHSPSTKPPKEYESPSREVTSIFRQKNTWRSTEDDMEKGIREVKGDQTVARQCYVTSCLSKNKEALIIKDLREDAKMQRGKPVEDLVSIEVYPREKEKTVWIGLTLKEDTKLKLVDLLRTYADIFTWTAIDMPGIDPEAIKKARDFPWTEDCQKSFEELKTYLSTPGLLSKPLPGEDLFIYLSVSKVAVSTILVREENGIQKSIYYFNKVLQDAQALADFIVECMLPEDPPLLVISKAQDPWNLYVDGSSTIGSSGTGIILISPESFIIESALRFGFQALNNEAEYEALLAGIRGNTLLTLLQDRVSDPKAATGKLALDWKGPYLVLKVIKPDAYALRTISRDSIPRRTVSPERDPTAGNIKSSKGISRNRSANISLAFRSPSRRSPDYQRDMDVRHPHIVSPNSPSKPKVKVFLNGHTFYDSGRRLQRTDPWPSLEVEHTSPREGDIPRSTPIVLPLTSYGKGCDDWGLERPTSVWDVRARPLNEEELLLISSLEAVTLFEDSDILTTREFETMTIEVLKKKEEKIYLMKKNMLPNFRVR